jgi:beta-lactamase regulating signal transducer with metallopeptidase domain
MPLTFLESLLRTVVHASWQAAILVLVVLVAGRLVPRMPAGAKSGLWLIVLARLLFPLTPQSSWSLFNLARFSDSPVTVATSTAVGTTGTERPAAGPFSKPSEVWTPVAPGPLPFAQAEPQHSTTISTEPFAPDGRSGVLVASAPSIVGVVSVVWALGVAVVIASGIRSWFRLRQFLRTCRPCADERTLAILERCRCETVSRRKVILLVSDVDVAPALAGIWFPRIIVSKRTLLAAIGPAELEWLFRHELAHVRRWDLAVVRLWWSARAVHWFNPLAWWAASRARVDGELACDAWVIGRAGAAEQAAYGQALLSVAELLGSAAPVPAAAGISLGEPVLSRRIRAIAGYRPAPRLVRFAVALVVVVLAGIGLTDASENPARDGADKERSAATSQTNLGAQAAAGQGTVFATFGLPTDAQSRPQLAAVLDAWQKGRGRLKSFDVYLTYDAAPVSAQAAKKTPPPAGPSFEIVWPSPAGSMPDSAARALSVYLSLDPTLVPNVGIGHLPQAAVGVRRKFSHDVGSGVKLRSEDGVAQPGANPAATVSVWDGELSKCELLGVKQFSVNGTLSGFGAGYEYFRASCANGSDMIDVLRKRPATVVERADEKGIVVSTPAPQPFGYRVWLDPGKNFQPVRIHRLLNVDGIVVTDFEQENTLAEVAPGVWSPLQVVVAFYPQDKTSATAARRPKSAMVVTVNRKYSRFNVPIDESLFQLPVPPGFQVGDDVCHRVYEFGKAKTSLTQISQWVLEGKMSAKDYKAFVKRTGVAATPVQGEVRLD